MLYDKLIESNFFLFQNEKIKNNSYVFLFKKTLVIIDPSWNAQRIINFFNEKEIDKAIIFMTHGHYDHIGDIDLIFAQWKDTIVYIHKSEKEILLKNIYENDWPFQTKLAKFINKICLYDFDKNIEIENNVFSFIETPGHSNGSTTIHYKNYYFTGDFIFLREIGRLDLIFSFEKKMIESIKKISKILKDDDLIFSGHRDIGSFKELKLKNNEYIEYLNK